MSLAAHSAVAAHAEQRTNDQAELDRLRAENRYLRTRLAIAERVARRLHDRDAASRAWAERLEREAYLAYVPEPRQPEPTEQDQAIASWRERRAQ